MKYSIMSFLALFFVLTSCNQDTLITTKNDSFDESIQLRSSCTFSFSESQFDSIGIIHNDLLDIYVDSVITSIENGDFEPSITRDSLVDYIYNNVSDPTYFNNNYASDVQDTARHVLFSKDYQKNDLTEGMLAYIDRSEDIIESISTYADLVDSIEVLVSEVNTDGDLNCDEYNGMRAYLAVSEHSAKFWMPANKGGSGDGESYINDLLTHNNSTIGAQPDPCWKKVLGADGIGAAGGALKWSAYAVYTLGAPQLTLAGYIANMAWGAGFASTIAYLKDC